MPIAPDLATIDEILNPDDLPVLIAHLHAFGIPVLFRFGAQTDLQDATNAIANIDQAGLGLPDREYYLKTDARSVELRDKYQALVQKELALAGQPAEQAAADARRSSRSRRRSPPPCSTGQAARSANTQRR
jgi:predicted metalloendopeptidase